jgi:outer membrane protein TolC
MNMTTEGSARQWFPPAKITAALLLLILGTKAEVMKAQDALSAGQKLTLTGAVDLALKQNLDIQIANIETATRQQDRVIARSELLPHASFEADESVNRYNLRAQIGIQIPNIPHGIGAYQAVHVGPTFSCLHYH